MTYKIRTYRCDSENWELTEEDFQQLDKSMTAKMGPNWQMEENEVQNENLRTELYSMLEEPDFEGVGEGVSGTAASIQEEKEDYPCTCSSFQERLDCKELCDDRKKSL